MDLKLKKFFKSHFLKKNGLFVDLPNIKGLKISTNSANLYKKKKKNDLYLFYFEDRANHAGLFTKSTAAA